MQVDVSAVVALITEAFSGAVYPGDDNLVVNGGAAFGEEAEVASAFRGRVVSADVPVDVLDRAPRGLSSALAFFSGEAFRFYLPAFMMADVQGLLAYVEPWQYLCVGVVDEDDVSPSLKAYCLQRFAVLSTRESAAVVAYLRAVSLLQEVDLSQCLEYWEARAKT